MYDFVLGGKDNYAVDRAAAARILEIFPELEQLVKENRAFLVRAVRYLAEQGIDQFIDLGTGIPTSPNVHEVAREVHPKARVVYVDNDPVVTVHNRALRASDDGIVAIPGDIRQPAEILGDPNLTSVIDFARPVGILFVDVLHFVTDEENPAGIVAAFRDQVAAGSHLVISAASIEGVDPERVEKVSAVYQNATTPLVPRPGAEIRGYFDGFDLVPPGVVNLTRWHADGPDIAGGLGGVGVKR